MERGIKSLFKGFLSLCATKICVMLERSSTSRYVSFFPNNIMDFNSENLRNLLAL